MYDPNNPNPAVPDGMASITSVPSGSPQKSFGQRPSTPGIPSIPGMPSLPGMPSGGLTPSRPGMPAAPTTPAVPGMGGLPTRPEPPIGGGMNSGAGGNFNLGGLQSFINAYRDSLFQWLAQRPEDGGDMRAWATSRPQFDATGLRQAMFAPPPAPTPVPAPAPATGPQTHTFIEPSPPTPPPGY